MKRKVIIIGGGIVGASAAYQLSKRGAEVILVDRKDDGQATDAAAGIICPWLSKRRNKAWYRMVKASAAMYPELIQSLEADGENDTGYKQVGAIFIHTDEEKLKQKLELAVTRRKDAPEIGDVRILNETETKEKFPFVADGYKSVFVSGAARVDGRKLRDALLRGAEKHGTKIIRESASLITEGNTIVGVKAGEEEILSDYVVAASGAWIKELLLPLGITFDVRAQKAQILHLHHEGFDTSNLPVVKPPNNQFMLSFDDSRYVVGATYEENTGYDTRVTAGGIYYMLNEALKYAPGLENSAILEARVGFRPVTRESFPIFGPLPDYEGLFIVNGLGSTGLTAGPFLGEQLAKLISDEPVDIILEDYEVKNAIKQEKL